MNRQTPKSKILYSDYPIVGPREKTSFWKKAALVWMITAMLGMGTYAYFSDVETSTGNSETAGILYLTVNGTATGTWNQLVTGVKTTYTNYTDNLVLRIVNNTGKIYIRISNITCSQGVQTPLETTEENGVPKFDLDTATYYALRLNGTQIVAENTYTLTAIKDKWIYAGQYPALTDFTMQQGFKLIPSTTNWAQGDYCTFTEQVMVTEEGAPAPTPAFP